MNDPLPPAKADQTLRRIAMALGCTVEDLVYDQSNAAAHDETEELLTLWDAIRSAAGRQVVLKAAREVVRSQGTGTAALEQFP